MAWYVAGDNYALGKTASQSHTYKNETAFAASKAVDGFLYTTTSTYTHGYGTRDYWWKVDIGEKIIFTYATIYVGTRKCK